MGFFYSIFGFCILNIEQSPTAALLSSLTRPPEFFFSGENKLSTSFVYKLKMESSNDKTLTSSQQKLAFIPSQKDLRSRFQADILNDLILIALTRSL